MSIFANRLTYGALDRPFVAAAIIGAAGAGAMICTCYLTGTRGDNALASVVGVGLSWFTGMAIILVPIRAVILLKTVPWAGRQVEYVARPDYPELHTLTYQATIPNLGDLDKALRVEPTLFEDWGIQVDKVPAVIDALLVPPYRATDAALSKFISRGGVNNVKAYLLKHGLGYPTGKTVELSRGGRAALQRVQALTHRV